jgi:hypothetical protein
LYGKELLGMFGASYFRKLDESRDSSQLYLDYQEMYRLRLASFQHFVKEPFEVVLWTDPATNGDTCAYQNWLDIKELWHENLATYFGQVPIHL